MAKMNSIDWITFVLIIIGALNWLLVGAVSFDLVEWLLGTGFIANAVYVLVGVSGLYWLFRAYKLSIRK